MSDIYSRDALVVPRLFVMKTKDWLLLGFILSVATVICVAADSGTDANKLRFSGTVLDGNGKPVSGATVDLYQFGRGFPGGGAEMKADQTTTTGANGAYEFRAPTGQTTVFARKAGLAPAWATYWNVQTDPP